jgi:hypothetical protein
MCRERQATHKATSLRSLTPLSTSQYYEMSYGLNIEMHKQVSLTVLLHVLNAL